MNVNLTLLFQVIFFAIFVWFCKKYVWTFLISALDERKTRIADGLAAAEKGQMAEEDGRKAAEKVIAEAKAQASEIIARAEKRDSEMVDEAKLSARQEGDRILAAAQAELETELNRAKESLRAQVSELAVAGAQKILKREVDAKAHADILDDLAAKL